jgi:hypothetical protein
MTNKDLLRQYVDTGLKVTEYQIKMLPDNFFKTYIRKRVISGQTFGGQPLNQAELDRIPIEFFNNYIIKKINNYKNGDSQSLSVLLSKDEFEKCNDKLKMDYANARLKKDKHLWEYEFESLSYEDKVTYIRDILDKVIEGKYGTKTVIGFPLSSPTPILNEWEYRAVGKYLGVGIQNDYIEKRIELSGNLFTDDEFKMLSDERKKSLVADRVKKSWALSSSMFEMLNHEQKIQYIKNELRITGKISPFEARKYYEEHMKSNVNESLKRYNEIIGYDK